MDASPGLPIGVGGRPRNRRVLYGELLARWVFVSGFVPGIPGHTAASRRSRAACRGRDGCRSPQRPVGAPRGQPSPAPPSRRSSEPRTRCALDDARGAGRPSATVARTRRAGWRPASRRWCAPRIGRARGREILDVVAGLGAEATRRSCSPNGARVVGAGQARRDTATLDRNAPHFCHAIGHLARAPALREDDSEDARGRVRCPCRSGDSAKSQARDHDPEDSAGRHPIRVAARLGASGSRDAMPRRSHRIRLHRDHDREPSGDAAVSRGSAASCRRVPPPRTVFSRPRRGPSARGRP